MEKKNNNHKKFLLPADFRETVQWRIFRIMSEFVDGFNFLADIKKSVTIFGSARTEENHPYYKEARKLGQMLAKDGYTVVTGGGPGVMEGANRGASEADGKSLGLNIQLPEEQRVNKYVKQSIAFHYFFTRKLMLSYSAQAYVFFPGGLGTLDEMFEIITLIQTKKVEKITMIAVNKSFWQPLYHYLKKVVYEENQMIDKEDLNLIHIVDTAEEAYALIKKSKSRQIVI